MDAIERPEDLVGKPLPDLILTRSDGAPYPLRERVGKSPLSLFFLIHVGSPG